MKALIIATAALVSLNFAGAPAEARSMRRYTVAEIVEMKLDPRLESAARANVGAITIDYFENTVKLQLLIDNCPRGAMCLVGPREVLNVELPIVSRIPDGCGSVVITAKQDARPVDGGLQLLTVTDNSARLCDDRIAGLVTATYETSYYDRLHGEEVSTHSSFTANAFGLRQ